MQTKKPSLAKTIRGSSLFLISIYGISCYSYIGHYNSPELTKIKAVHEVGMETYLRKIYEQPIGMELAPSTALRLPKPCKHAASKVDKKDQDFLAEVQAAFDTRSQAVPAQPPLLRFGLMSDVHIHEPGVKLFCDKMSRFLDHSIESAERNAVQEAFQTAVFAATLNVFEQLSNHEKNNDPEAPRFLMNLGDAIDTGTVFELYQYTFLA